MYSPMISMPATVAIPSTAGHVVASLLAAVFSVILLRCWPSYRMLGLSICFLACQLLILNGSLSLGGAHEVGSLWNQNTGKASSVAKSVAARVFLISTAAALIFSPSVPSNIPLLVSVSIFKAFRWASLYVLVSLRA